METARFTLTSALKVDERLQQARILAALNKRIEPQQTVVNRVLGKLCPGGPQ
ncbi:hypothetical protein ACFTWF_33845 [Rhodococcus sp. NPDC056960]|uniref:hypothetical protein n=1 Tax=Rhodococcus sp. NPDC056960 TaxID=3345982 RepID=UPI003637CC1E